MKKLIEVLELATDWLAEALKNNPPCKPMQKVCDAQQLLTQLIDDLDTHEYYIATYEATSLLIPLPSIDVDKWRNPEKK